MPLKENAINENEKLIQRRAEDSSALGEKKEALSRSQLVQMQQMHGNAFVQKMLAQRAKGSKTTQNEMKNGRYQDDVEAEASERVAKRSLYKTNTAAKISRDGTLKLNVGNAIDMRRYSQMAKAYRNIVREWQGSAAIQVNHDTFQVSHIKLGRDGVLTLKFGQRFTQALAKMSIGRAKGEMADIDYNRPLNAEVEASVHYRSKDPMLQKMNVPNKDAMLGRNGSRQQFFMRLAIKSVYIATAKHEYENKKLDGEVLLVGSEQPA